MPTTEALLNILRAHLDDPGVGPDDDFYAMGGDSLIALRVVADAQDHGLPITLRDLLYHPTAAGLAASLTTAAAAGVTTGAADGGGRLFALLPAADRALLPAGVVDALPASALQLGMIFLCESAGRAGLYRSTVGWRTAAEFDHDRFAGALAALTARHPALRTTFDLGGLSVAAQLVHADQPVPLTAERTADDADAARRIQQWHRAWLAAPIDWATGPLVACHVVALPGAFHVALASHHVVVDGWSYGRLVVELITEAVGTGGAPSDGHGPPAPSDHGAAVTGQHEAIAAERRVLADPRAAEHWLNECDTEPLLFPANGTGATHGTVADASAERELAIPAGTMAELRRAARAAHVPLKALVTAAHLAALAAWTGRDDVVTGVVVNTRPATPGADRLVGLYLNTVPLRLRAAGADPVVLAGDVLAAERRGAPYLAFPLARVEALLGRPAFDVVLNYTHFHVYHELDDPALPATGGWWVHGRPSFPFRVDIEVDGREAGDRVLVGFDPELIGTDRVGEYLRHLDDALTLAAR